MRKSSELKLLLGEVRQLVRQFKAGGPQAFDPFRELVSRLLSLTVMRQDSGVRLSYLEQKREKAVLGGLQGPTDPIVLNNGHYLRISVTLYVAPAKEERRLKVLESSFQYQTDREGKWWVFRYDYLRNPPHHFPAAHFQIRGNLSEDVLADKMLEKVHFPTWRIPLESVVKLLIDQFDVPANSDEQIWRPVLAETERAFAEIAHKPL